MTQVDAKPDPRIHVADDRQRVLWSREVLVLGAVVVDGNFDVVLLHESLDAREGLRRRRDNHQRHAAHARVFEVATHVFVGVGLQGDCAAPDDL